MCAIDYVIVPPASATFVLSRLDYGNSVLAEVGDHAASTRSERSSAADSQPTDERTREIQL